MTARKPEMTPLRVLVLNSGSEFFGGVSAYLYQVYRHIDRERICFYFLSPEKTTYTSVRPEIEAMGGHITELGIKGNIISRKIKLYRKLKAYLKSHPFTVVHINSGNFFFNLTASRAALDAGVPVRIVHSHSAGNSGMSPAGKFLYSHLKGALESQATHLAACSKKAAFYMFTKETAGSGKVRIFKNGIEADAFRFDPEVRRAVRREFSIENAFVVGHAGRFMKEKNHTFLIDIFAEVLKIRPDAKLLLLGDGELKDSIRKKAEEAGISHAVIFAGLRSDMSRMYQAMDVFVLPSLHEGLPVSCIEAQASGLGMVLSNEVTKEVKILPDVTFLPLNATAGFWAETIVSSKCGIREEGTRLVKEAGYSIDVTARELQQFYISCAVQKI